MYCDHWKMIGHTVQRCYKRHGYPIGHKLFKGKRMATMAHTDTISKYNVAQTQGNAAAPGSSHSVLSSTPGGKRGRGSHSYAFH